MMRVFCILVFLGAAGCAHQELEAPCGPLSMVSDDGCGELKPINVADDGMIAGSLS